MKFPTAYFLDHFTTQKFFDLLQKPEESHSETQGIKYSVYSFYYVSVRPIVTCPYYHLPGVPTTVSPVSPLSRWDS